MAPLIFIVGPTCSGKTDLAFYLAEKIKAQIINADSLQFYEGMDIGSAKPNFKKFPHIRCLLFSAVKPPEVFTAGLFEKSALKILKKILPSSPALVVGGSGFYLQALEKGCFPAPQSNNRIRAQLLKEEKENGLAPLYQELKEKDPEYAAGIHPSDAYRIVRSLSFIRSENKKMSNIQKSFKPRPLPYPLFKIGLTGSSEDLKKRIRLRVKNMIQRGLLKEVKNLMDQGLKDFPLLKSVGYKEAAACLQGFIQKEDLEDKIVQRTIKLVKKQKTWFKRDNTVRWYDCCVDFQEIYEDLKHTVLKGSEK